MTKMTTENMNYVVCLLFTKIQHNSGGSLSHSALQ